MLFLILFSIAFAEGSIPDSFLPPEEIENSMCDKQPTEACSEFEVPLKIPQSAEDVDNLCKGLVPLHHCISDFLNKCDVDTDVLPIRGIFDTGAILILCDKKSHINRIFVDNVKCMGDAVQDEEGLDSCSRHLDAIREETPDIMEKLRDLVPEDNLEAKEQLETCLEVVFHVGCLATSFYKACGPDAQLLYLWLAQNGGMEKNVCTEEHQYAIKEFVKIMKFELKK